MSRQFFYAVRRGRSPGVYRSWDETQQQVNGFSGAEHKKFNTLDEAEQWIEGKRPNDTPIEEVPVKKIKTSHQVTVYCDGACLGNGTPKARGGIGVYFGASDERNLSEPLDETHRPHTNQKAELQAAIRALQQACDVAELCVYSDSRYTLDSVTKWRQRWIQCDWNVALSNLALHRKLSDLADERHNRGYVTEWRYVAGHSNVPGNDAADALAKRAAESVDS